MGQFFDPLLIISMTIFCLNNSLQSSWHAFYKMLACFWRDIVPFLGQRCDVTMLSLYHSSFPSDHLIVSGKQFKQTAGKYLDWNYTVHDISNIFLCI